MLKKYINIIKQKKGMSLVEVMTAMTILALMIFCFAPLFLTYFQSIDIAGDRLDEVYHESGILQRVIGNINKSQTQETDGYNSTPFTKIPLTLTSNDGVSLIETTSNKDGNALIVGTESYHGKSIATGATIKTLAALTAGEEIGNSLQDIEGDILVSNPNNLNDSLLTFYANSVDSGFYCFPNSITDDFIKKDILVVALGKNATCSNFEIYVNVDGAATSDTSLFESYDAKYGGKLRGDNDGDNNVTAGVSWSIKKLVGEDDVFVLTVYGGRGITFENSPLIIKYGNETKAVEVDAPSMIMVGEANLDGDYNYYVSRGEVVDANNNGTADTLAILQRTMDDAPLTSAMNDVEWVPVESADNYATGKIDGTKYGYYVMCGDNGQVRRFWRNPDVYDDKTKTTKYGNYYWGGDYTYYTDYNLDRFSGENTYIYATDENGDIFKDASGNNLTDKDGNLVSKKILSKDTSFKYIAMRPMQWESGTTPDGTNATNGDRRFRTGFNMSSKKYSFAGVVNTGTAHLRNLCTVSATYGSDVQFYASDGKAISYLGITGEYADCDGKPTGDKISYPALSIIPSYDDILEWQNQTQVKVTRKEGNVSLSLATANLNKYTDEAWGWLDPFGGTVDSYYQMQGLENDTTINRDSYPITLTSVDAIRLSGSGAYETNVRDTNKSYYFTSGVIRDTDTSGDATSGTNASGNLTTQTNLVYPTSNYNLYCGYIPAYMDAWGSTTGGAGYAYDMTFKEIYSKTDTGDFLNLNGNNSGSVSKIGRASNRTTLKNNIEFSALWRLTMGITPYYTSGAEIAFDGNQGRGHLAYYHDYEQEGTAGYADDSKNIYHIKNWQNAVVYYPYTNLKYAITGKFYDVATYNSQKDEIENLFPGLSKSTALTIAKPDVVVSDVNSAQNNVTSGKVIDITISYLSDPMAVAISANPTDDRVYDLANNKSSNQVFYWHNRRESITFLDSASTVVASGDKDIPVSLMVGYVLGGTVMYGETGEAVSIDVTAVMNNGIVFLRAGEYDSGIQNSDNAKTGEHKAIDKTGYRLNKESNVFHQFYYLNSMYEGGNGKNEYHGSENFAEPSKGKHIGNLLGAKYWQNNRHIINRSITGGTPANGTNESYEYLRAHPMSDTKVNCVAWGTTWNGNPEAMWGTDNGTVLSWWVDTTTVQGNHTEKDWNDKSVAAEIQSYKWIDSTNGKTYKVDSSEWIGTVGSAKPKAGIFSSASNEGASFTVGDADRFKYFYDKGSQTKGKWNTYGFINTLENINDIQFADDIWVAVGDQSDRDPADYCPSGSESQSNPSLKANKYWETIKAYSNKTGTGRGGSWVNVRYWIDQGNGTQSDSNSNYHWRAVQITTRENCNIVQINNVNGMWIATGYQDGVVNGVRDSTKLNDEYDAGEDVVVCWAYDPLVPCGEDASLGGWSDKVAFYPEGATSEEDHIAAYNGTAWSGTRSEIGGINSCATRS